MSEINFITSNRGKICALRGALSEYGADVRVKALDLDLMEPQFDTVKEVSAFKVREAFQRMQKPVLVEDGGFAVEALKGFPGVYTKYILKTIGARGILNLLNGEQNRRAGFVSCASYIDAQGRLYQFERESGLEIEIAEKLVEVDSPYAWSELWKIIRIPKYGKTMCEMNKAEVDDLYMTVRGSLQIFAQWYVASADKKSDVA